jgi:hypothetical protein
MRALIVKDLRLLAPYVWLILGGHALFSANGAISPELLFWINVAMAAFYTVGLAIIDWRFEADRFVASLPVGRSTVVWARYLGGIGAAALGTGLYLSWGALFGSILPARLGWREGAATWSSPEGIAVFFLTATALMLLFLPFMYRFGLGRGVWGFVLAAGIGAAVAIPVLTAIAEPGTRAPSQMLGDVLRSVETDLGPALAWTAAFGAMATLTWLSARLSILGYRRRDL